MKAEDILGLMVPATFLFFFVTERLFPRREYPKIKLWGLVGFGFLIMVAVISTVVPLLLPPSITRYHLIDGSGLGVAGGVLIGYPLSALGSALLHRAFHEVNFLWRLGHQLHHSPRRLDIPGSVYFHPVDVTLQTAPATLVAVFLLGLDPVAAAIIGYIIQRPESHGLHHERGVHARNYSDFPLWDILMGTFRNPETFDGDVGFEGNAPSRVGAMLAFRDVNAGGAPGSPADAVRVAR